MATFASDFGQALFQLGKTDDAFAALTQAAEDVPALQPADHLHGLAPQPERRRQEGRGMV